MAARRWAAAGAAAGLLATAVACAPASWLAAWLADASAERLLLADARGTLWDGSAVLLLTGGPGSRDASALPGRVQWRLGLDGAALQLRARQACCMPGELVLRVAPGLGRVRLDLAAAPGALGHWPASWLSGLGTPWNTLQPSGTLTVSSPSGLSLEQVQGRWRFSGAAQLDLTGLASRLSTLDSLGSYRLTLQGQAATAEATTVTLATLEGALQLSGRGQLLGGGAGSRLRFTGEATAAPGAEAALANLLNIIGRRQGPASVISIG